MQTATPHDVTAARRSTRSAFALSRWALARPRAEEQATAAEAVGNPKLGAGCAAYALGVIDGAYGVRKAGHHPRYTQSGTRSQVWAHRGASLVDPHGGPPTRIAPLGPEYAPLPASMAQPGDIITVGHQGKRPEHTTLVVALANKTSLGAGFWCIGFNQAGLAVDGHHRSGELVLTFYPLAPGPGMTAHKVTSVPLDAYTSEPPHFVVDMGALELGRLAFARLTSIEAPGLDTVPLDTGPAVCPACHRQLAGA